MNTVEHHVDNLITALSEETGYTPDFLLERLSEALEDDFDLNNFIRATLEKKW